MENGTDTTENSSIIIPLRITPQSAESEKLEHITPMCRTNPAVQSHWSPSSLDQLQTCPRKYYYNKIERWERKGLAEALIFGSLYHKALEYHTKLVTIGGLAYEEALHATIRWTHKEAQVLRASEDTARTPTTLLRAIVWYLEDNRYSPISPVVLHSGDKAVELDWELILPMHNPDGEAYVLRGHFDMLVNLPNNEGQAIRERKTTKSALSGGYFAQWIPNNQTAAYAAAGTALFFKATQSRSTVPKILVEACQTLVNGTRFYTSAVQYSEAQIDEFIQDTLYWIRKAEEYAEMRYWPMNRTACDSKGGCYFRDACRRDPSTRYVALHDSFTKLPDVWEIEIFRCFLESILPTRKDTNANDFSTQP